MASIYLNDIVVMHRGDCFDLPIKLKFGNLVKADDYKISDHPNVKLYFGLMEPNQSFENAILKKVLNAENSDLKDTFTVSFKEKDTCYLRPGVYYYQAILQDSEGLGTVTIQPPTLFQIL